jgi:3-oxoadipate enol-lactonase
MAFVRVNGGDFYFERHRAARDDRHANVVIQHGVGRNSRFWQHWVEPLRADRSVVLRDQRGHGQSPAPGPGYRWTLQEMLDDLLGFFDAMELESVHYIGESMGAVLGVALAARCPERFASLTLCSMPSDLRQSRSSQALRAGLDSSAAAKRKLGTTGWARELMRTRVISPGQDPSYAEWAIEQIGRIELDALIGVSRPLYEPATDWKAFLNALQMPVLLLAPTQSPVTSLEDQHWIAAQIPDARVAVIDSPTHEAYVDCPQECLQAVRAFLAGLP